VAYIRPLQTPWHRCPKVRPPLQKFIILKFWGAFRLDSILLAEGCILRDLGVSFLLIIGIPPYNELQSVDGWGMTGIYATGCSKITTSYPRHSTPAAKILPVINSSKYQ